MFTKWIENYNLVYFLKKNRISYFLNTISGTEKKNYHIRNKLRQISNIGIRPQIKLVQNSILFSKDDPNFLWKWVVSECQSREGAGFRAYFLTQSQSLVREKKTREFFFHIWNILRENVEIRLIIAERQIPRPRKKKKKVNNRFE